MSDWKRWLERQPSARILLVKTSSAVYLREALIVLQQELPRAKIILWTEERESEEFYAHPAVTRVILYRNLRRIPSMIRELRSFAPYLVVTERTHEPTYDKMRVFAWAFLREPGLILDDSMRVVGFGGWLGRLPPTVEEVLAGGAIGWRQGLMRLCRLVGNAAVSLGFVLAAPLVLLALLGGAVRLEIRRRLNMRNAPTVHEPHLHH